MLSKIRKLGTDKFCSITHEAGDCAHCEAARVLVKPELSGIIFMERDDGEIRRVEIVAMWPLPRAMLCAPITQEAALAELAKYGPPLDDEGFPF